MKKHLSILIALAIVFWLVTPAMAADGQEITGTITSMTEALTKRAKVPYIRFIVKFEKVTDSGVKYEDSLPFMVFGTLVEEGRTYKEGQELTVVAKSREYQGRLSYTVLKFVKQAQASN